MDELAPQGHAADVLFGDAKARQCTATNRSGERCGRSSALGQFTCDHHGAKSPLSIKAGRERLLALVEPALDVLLRATRNSPPCEHCGRSDADRDPTAVRAAGMILDRSGYGVHSTVSIEPVHNQYDTMTEDDLIVRLETMLKNLYEQREFKRATEQHRLGEDNTIDGDTEEIHATVVDPEEHEI